LLIRRWVGRQTTVAQIVNLLYRRLGVGGRPNPPNRVPLGETRRLPTCDTADCQSALLIFRPLSVGHPASFRVVRVFNCFFEVEIKRSVAPPWGNEPTTERARSRRHKGGDPRWPPKKPKLSLDLQMPVMYIECVDFNIHV
jgi:hypothetical protein